MGKRRRRADSDSDANQSPEDSERENDQETSAVEDADILASAAAENASPLLAGVPSMSRILSVIMLILGILAVGILFYKVMAGFFVPLFLAALLVVIFRPIHQRIYHRVGRRARLAALATTSLIMLMVLVPIIAVISIAASQFTAMVSHVDFDDLTSALDRARQQIGISLEHPEQFRRLDRLADTLDKEEGPESVASPQMVLDNIDEAFKLVRFLQAKEPGPAGADLAAGIAEERLKQLRVVVQQHLHEPQISEDGSLIDSILAEEQFHRQSVIASAAIRSWMRELLGGTFRSQVRLLANPSAEDYKNLLNRARQSLQPRFVTLTSATGSFLVQVIVGLVVLVIALYFFMIDGSTMIRTLMRLSPLDDRYEARLLVEFDRTSRAVVLASVCSALAQGVLAAIAFYFIGFDSVILLFLVTSLMSLVPFLGAASVWVPCAIYLGAVDQRWTAAIILFIYGASVVSSIDNVIKMYVLHGRSTMHPLFALLSVLGGVQVFGPIGILVGPMVVVFLQTLLEILNHELEQRDTNLIDPLSEEALKTPGFSQQ